MSEEIIQQQEQPTQQQLNFAALRKQLEEERQARAQAELKAQELERLASQKVSVQEDDDDDFEPYVDRKKLKKELSKAIDYTKKETRQEIEQAVRQAIESERQQNYLRENPDYAQYMTPEKLNEFGNAHPAIAKSLMNMPDSFERQKLVYETMKTLAATKQAQAERSSIQEKVDANRRSPFFNSSSASAPYAGGGDYSEAGMKAAYEQIQALKSKMRAF